MRDNSYTNSELRDLKTQYDALIYFIGKLDIDMIDSILDNNLTYQDFPKYQFVQKLGCALNRFTSHGDTQLYKYTGTCSSSLCSKGCKGIRFVGNKSGLFMDLVIIENEGNINDIYECHEFSTVSPKKVIIQKVFIDTKDLFAD
jgi:hypothetical protein